MKKHDGCPLNIPSNRRQHDKMTDILGAGMKLKTCV